MYPNSTKNTSAKRVVSTLLHALRPDNDSETATWFGSESDNLTTSGSLRSIATFPGGNPKKSAKDSEKWPVANQLIKIAKNK